VLYFVFINFNVKQVIRKNIREKAMSYYLSIVSEESNIDESTIFGTLFDEDKTFSYKSGENILYLIFMRQNPYYLEYILKGSIEHSCLDEDIKLFSRETLQKLELCEEVERFIPKFLEKKQELINDKEKEMLQQEFLQELLKKVIQFGEEVPGIRLINTLPLKQEYQLFSLTRGGKLFLERVFGKEKVFQTVVGDMVQGPVNDLMTILECSFV
jgi:hypothetical protein